MALLLVLSLFMPVATVASPTNSLDDLLTARSHLIEVRALALALGLRLSVGDAEFEKIIEEIGGLVARLDLGAPTSHESIAEILAKVTRADQLDVGSGAYVRKRQAAALNEGCKRELSASWLWPENFGSYSIFNL